MEHRVGQTGGTTRILSAVRGIRRSEVFHAPGRGREISRSGATHFCQQRQNYFLFAAGGPNFFSPAIKWGQTPPQNPWVLGFFSPLAAVFWFVRNVEMTYFSERCRFYSEMRRCAVLHFGRSAAAGTEADQFHISGGLHFAAFARDAERQAHMCGARADFQTAGVNGVFGHFWGWGQK